MGRIQLKGVLASTRPMKAYGGVRFPERVVRSLADRLRAGGVQFGLNHDLRVTLDIELIDVNIRRDDDGETLVEITIEVDEGDYMAKGGAYVNGFSVNAVTHLLGEAGKPAVEISADAGWFSDDQLQAAYSSLAGNGVSVRANRLYQFSNVPDAVVLFTFIAQQLATVPTGLICNYIYDCLKNFLIRKKGVAASEESTDFAISFDDETGRMVEFHIRTSSEEVLKHAIDGLPGIIEANLGAKYEYLEGKKVWEIED